MSRANLYFDCMAVRRQGRTFDEMLKIFKRKVQNASLFGEIKKRRAFVKPSDRRRASKRECIKRLKKLKAKQHAR